VSHAFDFVIRDSKIEGLPPYQNGPAASKNVWPRCSTTSPRTSDYDSHTSYRFVEE
jgi:hypothetical protein